MRLSGRPNSHAFLSECEAWNAGDNDLLSLPPSLLALS
jgi:hypothetical protein